ncbi:MAG: hypothetical protein HXY23_14105, partial [Parvularculaceae bacterium]|nr:hypothetical protein [Parvularculaceae bacterium]
MSDTADAMRKAGKVQADPALSAIQELSDTVAASFEVLESETKKAREET